MHDVEKAEQQQQATTAVTSHEQPSVKSMSNEVWVRWKGTDRNDDWLFDTVNGLDDCSQIRHLRTAFMKQNGMGGAPALVEVRTTEDGEMLKASTPLAQFFAPPASNVAALPNSPGTSEDTALFLTIPPPLPQQLLVSSTLERIEKKLEDMATLDMRMSEDTVNFAASLLDDLKIKWVVHEVNEETGEGEPMEKYPWGAHEQEADGQLGCQWILEGEILPLEVNGRPGSFASQIESWEAKIKRGF
jgi:hypothetical protein